jgi:hypothetical protein
MTKLKISYFNDLLCKTVEKTILQDEFNHFKQTHKYVEIVGTVKPFNEQAEPTIEWLN